MSDNEAKHEQEIEQIEEQVQRSNIAAQRYFVKVDDSDKDGQSRLMFPALGNVVIDDDDSIFLYYTPGQPYATLYRTKQLAFITAWLQEEQKQRDILSVLNGQHYTTVNVDLTPEVEQLINQKEEGNDE